MYISYKSKPGVGVLPYISLMGMCHPKVPFLSENGYGLCTFWSGIGCGFRGNHKSGRKVSVVSIPSE